MVHMFFQPMHCTFWLLKSTEHLETCHHAIFSVLAKTVTSSTTTNNHHHQIHSRSPSAR